MVASTMSERISPGPDGQSFAHADEYAALLAAVQATFEDAARDGARLFTAAADGLYAAYLDHLPAERQQHDCAACRRFIEAYGGLVAIADDGTTIPAMWNPDAVTDFYRPAVAALHTAVRQARVTGVFLCAEATLGKPVTGPWTHFSASGAAVFRHGLLRPAQAAAAVRENFRTVTLALTELTAAMLDEALRLLRADALFGSEKFVGPVQWLRALHERPKGLAGENVLWRAVASAPEGYCHPRASVIGPLLEDIAAGLPFEDIKRRFEAKMHPLLYQRPQVAPTAANIAAAEAIVAKLGLAPSLERRYARLDEVETIWRPAPQAASRGLGGVFAHLTPKRAGAVPQVAMPDLTLTWEKFRRTVLPTAEAMEFMVPERGNFIALTTAVHAEAPPILKWDREDRRNPVASYVYVGGSLATRWGLSAGWCKVTAVIPLPNLWGDRPAPFLGEGVVLALDGAMDSPEQRGNALFPESLKQELYAVRATIEAYSRAAKLTGREGVLASGYCVSKSSRNCALRVLSAGQWTGYRIDRWD
jgi:hypothetical protein